MLNFIRRFLRIDNTNSETSKQLFYPTIILYFHPPAIKCKWRENEPYKKYSLHLEKLEAYVENWVSLGILEEVSTENSEGNYHDNL